MRSPSTLRHSLLAPLFLVVCSACAGAGSNAANGAAPASKDAADTGSGVHDAGSTNEPPFASSTLEATNMISAAVDTKGRQIGACVREYRVRKNLAHERVSISFGIDQEGKLLGVTSKGKEDADLRACVERALVGAPFPRSRAGIITITKIYEERLQERLQ